MSEAEWEGLSRPSLAGDDGSAATAMLFTNVADDPAANLTDVSISDGELVVKQRRYGWEGRDFTTIPSTTPPSYQALGDEDNETLLTAKFELSALADNDGAQVAVNGPKWIDGVISTLMEQRDLLSTLQGLDSADTQAAERIAWQKVQDAVQFNFFGGFLPLKLADAYDGTGDNVLESEADAIDLINRALDALSSNNNLEAALDPDGTGIFDHYDDPANTGTEADFLAYHAGNRRNQVSGRTIANLRGEREYKVFSAMGTTDFTRFGFWRRESTTSARRNDDVESNESTENVLRVHGGPGTYAYSPLDATNVGTLENLSFPGGGSASYTGETIAIQNTTILTGTVHVGVSWYARGSGGATVGEFATVEGNTQVGTMALTISGLASAAGDPLSQGGSDGSAGNEIADIVFQSCLFVWAQPERTIAT